MNVSVGDYPFVVPVSIESKASGFASLRHAELFAYSCYKYGAGNSVHVCVFIPNTKEASEEELAEMFEFTSSKLSALGASLHIYRDKVTINGHDVNDIYKKIRELRSREIYVTPGSQMTINKFVPLIKFLEEHPNVNKFFFTDADVSLLRKPDSFEVADNVHMFTGKLQEHTLGKEGSVLLRAQSRMADYLGFSIEDMRNTEEKNNGFTLSETYFFNDVNDHFFWKLVHKVVDVLYNYAESFADVVEEWKDDDSTREWLVSYPWRPNKIIDVQMLHMLMIDEYRGYDCISELSSFRDVNPHNFTKSDYDCAFYHLGGLSREEQYFFYKYIKYSPIHWSEMSLSDIERQREYGKDNHSQASARYLDLIEEYIAFSK